MPMIADIATPLTNRAADLPVKNPHRNFLRLLLLNLDILLFHQLLLHRRPAFGGM